MLGTLSLIKIGGTAALMIALIWAYNTYTVVKKSQISDLEQQIEQTTELLAFCESNITTLKNNLRIKESEVRNRGKIIDQLEQDFDQMREDSQRLRLQSIESRKDFDALVKLFRDHDLGYLINQKPGLIELRINSGTDRILKKLEEVTGNNP